MQENIPASCFLLSMVLNNQALAVDSLYTPFLYQEGLKQKGDRINKKSKMIDSTQKELRKNFTRTAYFENIADEHKHLIRLFKRFVPTKK